MIACGETGVGKTYRNLAEIKGYMNGDRSSKNKGRKVLCFDTNGDDYKGFPSVNPNHVKALTKIAARRILPFHPNGSLMSSAEKVEIIEKVLRHYRNGLLVLDDVDHYMAGAKGQSMVGALCTVRHLGLDILFSHQSLAKITTTQWQNCTWLRLHHQVDDIARYKNRIPNYHSVRIAQFILDESYLAACELYRDKKISLDEFRKRKSYCLYVNIRTQKIYGASKSAFIRAAKKYVDEEKQRQLKMMLSEKKKGKIPLYSDLSEARVKLIGDLLHLWEEKPPSIL